MRDQSLFERALLSLVRHISLSVRLDISITGYVPIMEDSEHEIWRKRLSKAPQTNFGDALARYKHSTVTLRMSDRHLFYFILHA